MLKEEKKSDKKYIKVKEEIVYKSIFIHLKMK